MTNSLDIFAQEYHRKGIPLSDLDQLRHLSKENPAVFRCYAHRRLFHEPLAYICGKKTFYNREFKVDCRVYVPNSETETMVRTAIQDIPHNMQVLDIGTGCGNIAITLAKERGDLSIFGSDLVPSALEVAEINAKYHGVKINFYESRYADDLDDDLKPDVVVSDMPYGDKHYTLGSIDLREFKHMPPVAIFDPRGILTSYQELLSSLLARNWHPLVYFESGRVEKDLVEEIIPPGKAWEYRSGENYSYTCVQL